MVPVEPGVNDHLVMMAWMALVWAASLGPERYLTSLSAPRKVRSSPLSLEVAAHRECQAGTHDDETHVSA